MEPVKKFGRYDVVRVLGSGAMGVVYEGYDAKLKRRVAIKTIHKGMVADTEQGADYSRRFVSEAQSVARLSHPNIVTVYDYGDEEDCSYIVMEFIHGRDLKQRFANGEVFPLWYSLRLMIDLLDALNYAHAQGIVHRDIKPANLMIEEGSNRLKLTDFGVAKVLDNPEGTQSGTVVGTPGYMSPEQILGQGVSPQTDIFSVGVILYQLVSGKKPFEGEGTYTIQEKIINEEPAALTVLNGELPAALEPMVKCALAKQPKERYASAKAFAEDLGRILDSLDATQGAGELPGDMPKLSRSLQNAGTGSDTLLVAPSEGERTLVQKGLEEGSNVMCSVLVLDLVGYSKRSNAEQSALKKRFCDLLAAAIEDVPHGDLIVLDSGDGAELSFLGDVEEPFRIARSFRELNLKDAGKIEPLSVRMGINIGPCRLVKDVKGEISILGGVTVVAQGVTSVAEPGQIMMTRAYRDMVVQLRPDYPAMLRNEGKRKDKKNREYEVYSVLPPGGAVDASASAVQSTGPATPAHAAVGREEAHETKPERDGKKQPSVFGRLKKALSKWFFRTLKLGLLLLFFYEAFILLPMVNNVDQVREELYFQMKVVKEYSLKGWEAAKRWTGAEGTGESPSESAHDNMGKKAAKPKSNGATSGGTASGSSAKTEQ